MRCGPGPDQLDAIDSFDIDEYKKADARATIKAVTADLEAKWQSSKMGKVLLQYSGFNGAFRRAERKLRNAPKRNQKPENAPTAEQEKQCAQELVDILNAEAARTLNLDGRQRRVFVQYLIFGKAFENTTIDYYRLYQMKYPS